MKSFKKIILLTILINILFVFTGCSSPKKDELKDKTITELGYLNIKLIDILNSLNNISYEKYKIVSKEVKLDKQNSQEEGQKSDSESGNETKEDKGQELINTTQMATDSLLAKSKDDINWGELKPEIETISESWSIVFLDLYSQNIDKAKILDFNTKLDTAMIAIKNENKKDSLKALALLYKSIPEFLEKTGADKNTVKIRQTQMYIINAYSLADDMENEEINSNIKKAIEVFKEVMEDTDYTYDKTFKTNKTYVLLNDLANCLETKDSDIFYVKYKNFMETINEI